LVDFNMLIQEVGTKLTEVLSNFAAGAVNAILAVIVIAIFVVIGLIVALVINKVIVAILDKLDFNKILKSHGFKIKIAGFKIEWIITTLVKLFLTLTFLGAAVEIVELGFLTDIIKALIAYIPSLVQGLAIIIGAILLSEYIVNMIRATHKLAMSTIFASVIQVFIAYIALVLALPLILPGIQTSILETAFELFIGAAAIGIGIGLAIAFGWGFKDAIAASAKKHNKMFDRMFESVGKK